MMEYKCPSCGNVFDDTLGVCPACGSTVTSSANAGGFVEQITSDAAAPEAAAASQQAPQPQQTDAAQNAQQAPSYQYASYSYGAGQQPQPTYQQQPTYQNYPTYGQQGYAQPGAAYVGVDPNAKSKIVGGLLGIFLGGLGVHNFYLGYTGKAVAQLLISILSCGMLSPISAIWGLVEGILILTGSTITTDASGRPLGD